MKTILPPFILLLLFILPFWGFSQDFDIKKYDVKITIDTNGYFDVNENILVYFNARRRGIYRDIPYKYESPSGETITTHITNIKVEGHQQKVIRKGNTTRIRIGNPNKYLTGEVNYNISYRVYNAFNYLEDRTEFYWNVTGPEWQTTIANASYQIIMPDDIIVPDEDIVVLAGPEGSREKNATIRKVGRRIEGNSTTSLPPGSAMTVAINLPPDYIKKPTGANSLMENTDIPSENQGNRGDNNVLLGLLASLGALFSGLYGKYGRNKNKPEITEKYYPPDNMTSAEVGTFYDYSPNPRDLISLIPHWGNQGLLEINAIEGHDGERDIYFRKLQDIDPEAHKYEKTMFNGIFKNGSQVFLSDLKEKYYTTLLSAQSEVKKEIMDPRLYDPVAMKYFHSIWSIFASIFLIFFGVFLMVRYQFFITGIVACLFGIVVMVIRFIRPKLSEEGLALHYYLEGFKAFLENPSPDKLHELTQKDSQYLEKMLPFAIAFGLDKSWNASVAKADISYHAPAWYVYHTGNQGSQNSPSTYIDFSNAFDVKHISSVFRSSPQSSGGSGGGSSGGGFSGGSSGGGFGGGGGGSW